jgi:hypothetical protein
MKQFLFFFFLLVANQQLFSQQAELESLVAKLQASCSTVETAAKTYEQEIKLTEYSSIQYSVNETDKKGSKTQYSYSLNFADLDAYTAREVTQKDIILVVLSVKNKQKLVKVSKNGETQAYDNEVSIHARNVDHAREVLELIKKAIPLGEKITASKLKLQGYQEMVTWLVDNVKNVTAGTKSITQNIRPSTFVGSLQLTQIENDGKSSQQEEFVFNLADINLNTINFKISGNRFGIGFEMMQRIKSVKVMRDGKPRPFNDEVLIYTNNVDEARDIRTVLTLAVPLAINKVKADFPNFKSKEDVLDKIFSLVKDVKLSDKTYGQTSTMKCMTEIVTTEQTTSASTKSKFEFNWMDINSGALLVKTNGEKMTIELPVLEKKKLVMKSKNDKFEAYDNELSVFVEDYEIARRLKNAIEKITEGCKTSYKDPFPNTNKGMMDWLKNNIGEVTIEQATKKQAIELAEEGNENKIKLTNTEVKSNTSVQEIFEFNLSDINPTTINYEIKGKWLYITFETNFKNKIIKAYKDGKIQPYVYSLDIVMKDVETGRAAITALKKLTENFKGK